MRLSWQVIVIGLAAASFMVAHAEPSPPAFEWTSLVNSARSFSQALDMLNTERDEYATHLAVLAGNQVNQQQAAPAALEQAQRLLSLALRLSPRNKRALVVNFQLSKGLVPDAQGATINPLGLARLLFTRGQLLEKNPSWENQLAARMLTTIAAELDPKNDDAVYASEVARLDHGEIDWNSTEESPTNQDAPVTEQAGPTATAPQPPHAAGD